jgi:hypothetical protein
VDSAEAAAGVACLGKLTESLELEEMAAPGVVAEARAETTNLVPPALAERWQPLAEGMAKEVYFWTETTEAEAAPPRVRRFL